MVKGETVVEVQSTEIPYHRNNLQLFASTPGFHQLIIAATFSLEAGDVLDMKPSAKKSPRGYLQLMQVVLVFLN